MESGESHSHSSSPNATSRHLIPSGRPDTSVSDLTAFGHNLNVEVKTPARQPGTASVLPLPFECSSVAYEKAFVNLKDPITLAWHFSEGKKKKKGICH